MAKKAKRAKTAKKTKKAKKTKAVRKTARYSKSKKTKKPTKPIRAGASGTDPCAAQERRFKDAGDAVDRINNQLADTDLPPAERHRLEKELQAANTRLTMALGALDRCRRQQS